MQPDEDVSQDPKDSPANLGIPKIIPFEDLVICGDEVWIQFKGQIYRLRRTKHDKLILTK